MIKQLLAIGLVTLLAGCATTGAMRSDGLASQGASQPDPPVAIRQEGVVMEALACFGQNWPNKRDLFGIPETLDETGKVDMGDGGTGRLLPENAANFISEALQQAGLQTADLRKENFELMEKVAKFGGTSTANRVTNGFDDNPLTYIVRGSFTTADFTGATTFDGRVMGFGPTFDAQGVNITTHVAIIDPNNMFRNLGVSRGLRVHVSYTAMGFGVGTLVDGKLVTAGLSVGDQQELQFTAGRLSMILGTMDAMSRLPQAPSVCKEKVEAILASR